VTRRPGLTIAAIEAAILDEIDRQAVAEAADVADVRAGDGRIALRPNGGAINIRSIAVRLFDLVADR
jgi:hypothetical protein